MSAFSATEVCDGAYISFQKHGKLTFRILIQYFPYYDKEKISKQRKKANQQINQAYHIKAEAPLFETLQTARINLIVCEEISDELIKWVECNTEKLLSRNESIINAAVVTKENIMLFPDCLHGPSYVEVNKYEAASRILCNSLSS